MIRRIALAMSCAVEVRPPIRVKRHRIIKAGELERTIEFAARLAGTGGRILVLLDADDDCPAELGPSLLERARHARSDRSIRVVLAKAEFEAWFLASALSLAGHRGLPLDLEAPADAESVRDAKGWLSRSMLAGHSYRAVLDQPALAVVMDLALARQAPSFDKFWRDVEALLRG